MQAFADCMDEVGQAAISRAAKSASDAAQKASEESAAFGWGLEVGDGGNREDLESKINLAKSLCDNHKLRQIAKQAGRLKRVAAAKQKSMSRDARHTIESVETGNNLAHLLPSQYLAIKVPAMRPLFAKSYSEKNLLQYKLGGKESVGHGPIIVCIDSSGSMEGDSEIWAKAVTLALLGIANKQKRHCRLIHFSSKVRLVDDFPARQQPDQSRLLKSMRFFDNRGTNWEPPLDQAVECIKSDKNLKNADIILITDGECAVYPDWLKEFKAAQKHHEFTVYGVMIQESQRYTASTEELAKVADTVINVRNLNDDEAISEVFAI